MAYVALTFSMGEVLTAAKMTQLMDNIAYLKDQLDDPPRTMYAEEVGAIASVTILAGQSSAAFSITLTGGRFTQTPKVVAWVDNASSGAWCTCTGTSTTAASGRLFVPSNVGANTNIPVAWHAMQMQPGSATG